MQSSAGILRRCAAIAMLGAVALVSAAPASLWAWGAEGHRITGLVAAELLTPKARLRLNQLIPGADLADIALYMDINRQDLATAIPGSDKWHYDNEPVCKTKTYAEYCPNGDCASSKIPVYFKVLTDPASSAEARVQAIRFLVHMIGDIHQPLHAADDNDQGANLKFVSMPDAPADLPPRRLHAVWDSDLVKLTTRGSSEADYARQLLARFGDSNIAAWQSGTVRDWMKESWTLSSTVTYGKLPGFVCGQEWLSSPAAPQRLTQAYVDAALEPIPAQLAKAGARIAWVLNTALEAGPSVAGAAAAAPDAAFMKLHRMFVGKWNGSLEYRDFRSDRRATLPATLEIAPRVAADGAELVYQYVYDGGPGKVVKSVAMVRIDPAEARYSSRVPNSDQRDDYRIVDGLADFLVRGEGTLLLLGTGIENEQPVEVRSTLTINAKEYSLLRETRSAGQEFAFRHAYKFTRADAGALKSKSDALKLPPIVSPRPRAGGREDRQGVEN
ncbi:MAG TPA: S1/P1 nuclease [Usitatibacteraceae bacterium]